MNSTSSLELARTHSTSPEPPAGAAAAFAAGATTAGVAAAGVAAADVLAFFLGWGGSGWAIRRLPSSIMSAFRERVSCLSPLLHTATANPLGPLSCRSARTLPPLACNM
eukprot:5882519-Pyramimonas_sp.AAC.1